MALYFNEKTYRCEYVDLDVNEVGQVVVTLVGDFPAPEKMGVDEASSILNDPLFAKLLRLGFTNAKPGTPLHRAFERLIENGGTAILRFQQSDDLEDAA